MSKLQPQWLTLLKFTPASSTVIVFFAVRPASANTILPILPAGPVKLTAPVNTEKNMLEVSVLLSKVTPVGRFTEGDSIGETFPEQLAERV